eukprot:6229268-Prymnesium_polylepis.1
MRRRRRRGERSPRTVRPRRGAVRRAPELYGFTVVQLNAAAVAGFVWAASMKRAKGPRGFTTQLSTT